MKRATVAVWLSVFALLTLGLSGCGTSTPPSIGVGLTPNGTKSIDQAQTVSITAAVSNDSKSAGVTWTVSGTNGSQGTLTNPTTTSVTYNTPASVTSAFTATVTATSVTDTTKVAVLKITVSPLPSITTTSLAAATAGTAYSATLVEAGGTSPYTWTVTPATLPAGLSLNSSTGVISGMPTGGSTGPYTFKITDAAGQSASSPAIAFTVAAPPALTVTTATLPAAVMGTVYSQTLQAAGGVQPYTWSVPPGTLPAGLTLNSSTGIISGTPTGLATGTIPFTVTVTDVETPKNATAPAPLSIAVSAPTLSVTTSSLPGGTMGNAYSQMQLAAKGGAGADTWKLATGSSLPAGLNLSGTGMITGTPSGNVVGPTSFTVVVTDSETPTAQTASATLSIAITVAPLSVTTSGSLPTGVANSVYPGVTLLATGGIQPYINWSVVGGNTNLPPGLTLNAATGAISGTPTTAGTTTFTVTVTDSEATPKTATSATLTITVNPAVSVTTNSLPAGVVGTVYPAGTTLQAAGGVSPYTWAVTTGSLPAGLTLNASTGAITGKPTGPAVGTISFTVTVTDSESPTKTATQSLSIVITAPQLTVTTTTASLPTGVLGNTYSTTLAASGGAGAYTWAVTGGNASLPLGLTLNTATGVISGTPTATGQTTFTVTVTDSETPKAQTASASLTITVNNSAPLAVTTTSSQLPTGVNGTPYPPTTLQASGGVTPYTWSISGNPSWLSISPSGVLSGTPNATGKFTFTAKVTDSSSPANTKTASLSITVDTPITVTTTSPLPTGYVGSLYSQTLAATGGSGTG
ncbi:MAG TPA: putative Ig domain-containing protein, partial [Terriglobales bacterium]|nr:putative Ig domain-containing protein [Terriglobales bacterium]